MKINVETIRKMEPCKSRFDDNFLKYYPNFDGTFEEFIDLANISYDDKIWVSTRFLNKNQLVHFSILCAESTLGNYERLYPNDSRIKDCLKFMKTIVDFSNLSVDQLEELKNHRSAAWSAAESARSAAESARSAAWSARSAAWSARSAAESAGSAAESAGSAAWSAGSAAESAESAAESAESAAESAESAAEKEQFELNLQFLKIVSNL